MTHKEILQAELIEAQTILINFISIWGKFADLLQTDKLSAKFISRQFDKIGPLKKKLTELEQSISQLQEGECYPREFVEWINWEDDRDDFHFIKDYTMNLWLNADEDMLGYNTDELFDYWQSKVKPK